MMNDDQRLLRRTDAPTAFVPPEASKVDINIVEDGLPGQLRERLHYIVRRKFKLREDVAEDLVQTALITYLEVRHRYPIRDEHPRILVGILRNKCREYIRNEVRSSVGTRALKDEYLKPDTTLDFPRAAFTSECALSELVQRESGRLILEALCASRPRARRMFELIRQGATRQDLIRILDLNKNTLDSRLHAYRAELRQLLARQGVQI